MYGWFFDHRDPRVPRLLVLITLPSAGAFRLRLPVRHFSAWVALHLIDQAAAGEAAPLLNKRGFWHCRFPNTM